MSALLPVRLRTEYYLVASLLLLLVVVLTLSACGAGAGNNTSPGTTRIPAENLTAKPWILQAFTYQGQPQILIQGTIITISFASSGHKFNGSSGCNSYSGNYSSAGAELQFSDMVSTLVACTNASMMQQEAHYLDTLAQITTFHIDTSGLTLQDTADHNILHYTINLTH